MLMPCHNYRQALVTASVRKSEDDIFQTTYLDELPIRATDIQQETKHDSVPSKALQYTLQRWPNSTDHLPEALKPYYNRKDQLTVEHGCVLWCGNSREI